jgi:hypothetical protein
MQSSRSEQRVEQELNVIKAQLDRLTSSLAKNSAPSSNIEELEIPELQLL